MTQPLLSKSVLTKLVAGMFAILILLFVFILFKGFGGSQPFEQDLPVFSEVGSGETKKLRHDGNWLWVSRLDQQQIQQLQKRHQLVGREFSCCDQNLCVFSAATERSGIDLVFTEPRPPQLADQELWLGGFVNPNSGAVYDLSGSAYQKDGAELELVCP